jgi:hypothetical protein
MQVRSCFHLEKNIDSATPSLEYRIALDHDESTFGADAATTAYLFFHLEKSRLLDAIPRIQDRSRSRQINFWTRSGFNCESAEYGQSGRAVLRESRLVNCDATARSDEARDDMTTPPETHCGPNPRLRCGLLKTLDTTEITDCAEL